MGIGGWEYNKSMMQECVHNHLSIDGLYDLAARKTSLQEEERERIAGEREEDHNEIEAEKSENKIQETGGCVGIKEGRQQGEVKRGEGGWERIKKMLRESTGGCAARLNLMSSEFIDEWIRDTITRGRVEMLTHVHAHMHVHTHIHFS